MKIVAVVGARPSFIKHAPLSKEIKRLHQLVVIHTGQHYDYNMSQVFFDELGIPAPEYNLGAGPGTHAEQTVEMVKGMMGVLVKEKPDLMIVYGDTNSALAGALAAVKLRIRLAHVESGLRQLGSPWPEEINRAIADYNSDYRLCPTQTAVDNLRREGMTEGVYLCGDVMVDAMDFNKEIAEKSPVLEALGLTSKQYVLITTHRAGNTDVQENLDGIVKALTKLGSMGVTVVFPIHPRTAKMLKGSGQYEAVEKAVKLIEPQGYLEFLKLMNHARKIITDSGGIQKESYMLKVPCITLLDVTPWVETVDDGWNVLAGASADRIVQLVLEFEPGNRYSNVFGKGACEKIVRIIGD
jgi:UDP-GlcNAc3NAcA epimerase